MPATRVCALVLILAALSARANVFGTDHRIAVRGDAYPIRAIGLVRQLDGARTRETCTGALVGRRLVLTAAHCVGREGAALSRSISTVFVPEDRRPRVAVAVWAGDWRQESDPRGGDWAVLLLGEDGGDEVLPVVEQDPRPGQRLALLGYSVDRDHGETLSGDFDCRVRLVLPDGVFHHDCALFAGASGGPILVADGPHWRIIGVQSAHKSDGTVGLRLAAYDSRHANLGTSARRFSTTVQQLRERYDVVDKAVMATAAITVAVPR